MEKIFVAGGEERVLELLEDKSTNVLNKPLLEGRDTEPESHPKSFRDFFLDPCALGEQLFSIIKFGLVQYVSENTCNFWSLF